MPNPPFRRIRDFFERSVAEDVDRELQYHLEMRAEELVGEGWSAADARAEARRLFGDYGEIEHRCQGIAKRHRRAEERANMFDALRHDLRFAIRQLVQRPAFAAMALLTLALGIGATSVIYSLLDGVVLQPLPYPEPARLVDLVESNDRGGWSAVSNPNFIDWRDQSFSFDSMAAFLENPATVQVARTATPSAAVNAVTVGVSHDFFEVFRVPPRMGRPFVEEELQEGGDPAVVVSDSFYRRHLQEEIALDDQRVLALGVSFRVVGVMPATFDFPEGADVWYPRERWPDTSGRTGHNLRVVARLADDVELAGADAEMQTIAAQLLRAYPEDNDATGIRLTPLKDELVRGATRPLLLLLAAAAMVLLVAATNLASSLLARAIERRGELAIRGALGAGRERVLRQLLTEAILLTTLGGLLGLLVAHGALELIRAWEPGRLPRLDNVAIDHRVLLFSIAVSIATGVFFGLVPAISITRKDLQSALAEGRKSSASAHRGRLWDVLVGAEVALALVLLIGSMLLLRTLWGLLDVDPGFETEGVLALDITVPDIGVPESFDAESIAPLESRVASYLDRLLADLEGLPEIGQAAVINALPLRSSGPSGTFCVGEAVCWSEESGLEGDYGTANYRVVSDDYFEVMQVPLLSGRSFDRRDDPQSAHVIVINEALAREYFPDRDPVGQQMRPIGLDAHSFSVATIVGVVADVRQAGLDRAPRREMYLPQNQRAWRAQWSSVVLRATTDEQAAAASVRALLRRDYPALPAEIVAMDDHRMASISEQRFSAAVFASFALLAVLLAMLGIWAVTSYRIAQRTRELGIRLALGARPAGVLRMVFRDTFRVVAIGAVAGLALAFALSRFLSSQLYGVTATDLPTFLVTVTLLLAIALLAALLPARRVTHIDPVAILGDR